MATTTIALDARSIRRFPITPPLTPHYARLSARLSAEARSLREGRCPSHREKSQAFRDAQILQGQGHQLGVGVGLWT